MSSRSYQERWDIYRGLRTHETEIGKADLADIFIWDRQLETGIPELDRQHQKLAQLINVLGRILSADLENELLEKSMFRILDELAAYVDYHFRFKEDMLERYQCDKEIHGAHINAHADFIREIAAARASGHDNPIETTGRTLTFLSEWLVKHIFETDMRMAKFIMAIQSGMAAEEAARQADSFMKNSPEEMRLAMGHLYANLSSRTQALLDAKRTRELKEEIVKHSDHMQYKH